MFLCCIEKYVDSRHNMKKTGLNSEVFFFSVPVIFVFCCISYRFTHRTAGSLYFLLSLYITHLCRFLSIICVLLEPAHVCVVHIFTECACYRKHLVSSRLLS